MCSRDLNELRHLEEIANVNGLAGKPDWWGVDLSLNEHTVGVDPGSDRRYLESHSAGHRSHHGLDPVDLRMKLRFVEDVVEEVLEFGEEIRSR